MDLRTKKRKNILIVDDEPGTCTYLSEVVGASHNVDTASNTKEALEAIKQKPYDVVVVDYRMPDHNGIYLSGKIREFNPDTKVILMTGYGGHDVALEAIRSRVFDYVDKPFEEDNILDLIDNAIIHKNQEEERRRLIRIGQERETRLKMAQEQNVALQEALLDLSRTRDQLLQSEKLASLGVMAAGIAHELNNPLAIIQGMAHLIMRDKKATENTHQKARKILESSHRMQKIIEQMRLSGMESVAEDWETVQINDILSEAMESHEEKLNRAGISYRFSAGKGLPIIHAHSIKLHNVFQNLLNNSIQAFSEGSEEADKLITITTEVKAANGVTITFADNAKGIPPEHLGKIFDPFFTTRDAGQGSGLGLYIAYKIIKEHKGQINVASEEGQGTRLTIWLPEAGIDKETLPADRGLAKPMQEIADRLPRILILEDEDYLVDYLREVFEEVAELRTFQDPEAALKEIEEETVDLVLTDVKLPGISGLEVLRRVRAYKPDLPVILITGYAKSSNEIATATNLGVTEILTKPFDEPEKIRSTILRYLAHFKTPRPKAS